MAGGLVAPATAFAAPSSPAPVTAPAPAPHTPAPVATTPATGTTLAGKTVFLDPGHQGSGAGHDLDKQVPDGRGGTKPCQTTGATAVTGVPEHTINWDVVTLVKAGLESQGAKVVLSRPDDTGWGGCVDERAKAASESKADVAVNIHADSTSTTADTKDKGFHIIVPQLPLPNAAANTAQSNGGLRAATAMRDSFVKAGFTPANYAGVTNGLQTRSDIAAVNLTTVPDVFIEMGNLSNPDEAKALSGTEGQVKYAAAITGGIMSYLTPASAGVGTPSLPLAPSGPSTPINGNGDKPVDLSGLEAIGPFLTALSKVKTPTDFRNLLAGQGQDVSSQVLTSMLSVIYAVFGGKLPM
ncbi:hypothetical protein GCM10027169_20280 [Gordonia jinhuaensis]|uniref:MurNAc-LAA domain-containing protein n=1 Tax=Gordonia jinhuaensis TaxID=1517702 RepID=A0A916TGS0_9ACTN|nr:hypothetical protein GCM10011489_34460 [Gordonia jinhuaensis]